MNNNYLISTGGSGGHVIPATILYDHLAKNSNIIISTDKRGLKFLDQNLYQLKIINTPKLNNIFFLPFNLVVILFLTFKSFFFLKKKKINKIFSTGGYMSLPLILAARFLKLKIYLVEPNQILGRANRYFLKYCKKIFCYTETIKNFPKNFTNKIITINPLVRESIYKLSLSDKITKKFNLLIVGGSQGANIFDNKLKKSIVNISKKVPIRVIQQTSEKNVVFLTNFYSKNNVENNIFSFVHDFAAYIHQADLCITRAGASALAELSVLNIPFIAVPLPTSKDNHQLENAKFYQKKNCCWIMQQNYFEEKIDELLLNIIEKKSDYSKKKENLKKLNYQNTWINANQKIMRSINEN